MTTSMSFPSADFPGFPYLSVEAPEQWVGLGAVGLPLALARNVEGQTFRPSLLVSVSRVGAESSFESQCSALLARLKKLPRFKEVLRDESQGPLGQELFVEGRFVGGKGELLKQFVRVVFIKRGFVYDVVEITGTVSLLTRDNGEDEVRDLVHSVEIAIP